MSFTRNDENRYHARKRRSRTVLRVAVATPAHEWELTIRDSMIKSVRLFFRSIHDSVYCYANDVARLVR